MYRTCLKTIPTECIHNNSVFKKALIKINDIRGDIQTMNYAWLEKDMMFEPHKHEDCVEFFFILEGNGKIKIEKSEYEIKKEDFITIEQNESHSIKNIGDKKLEFISLRVKSECN